MKKTAKQVLDEIKTIDVYPFKTPYNQHLYPRKYNLSHTIPNQTVPDLSMTVEEMLRRTAMGLPLQPNATQPYFDSDYNTYDENNVLPDINRMDYAEREAFIQGAQAELDEIKIKHNAYMKALKKKSEAKAKADQGMNVQRTTGSEVDQGKKAQPDRPVS